MLALPNKSVDNIDISAQYTVFAVRTLHARTGKKVDIIGHSQGGLSPRFALRFWPGIRPLVDDVVSRACQVVCVSRSGVRFRGVG